MSVYKDTKSNTWKVYYRFTDWQGKGTSINKAWLSYETRGACLGAETASQGRSRFGYDL